MKRILYKSLDHVCISGILLFSLLAKSNASKENMSPDAQALDAACASDAQTAGCSGLKVGTGLLKCLHKYKTEHKEYKFSKECREAKTKLRNHKN